MGWDRCLDAATWAYLIANNSNFIPGKPGEPVLVSWDDAATLFHKFGPALHGLLSDVRYPSLAGTAVCRDYVELPSQLLERIERAATFNQGFAMVEYWSSALVDMKLHLAGDKAIDHAPRKLSVAPDTQSAARSAGTSVRPRGAVSRQRRIHSNGKMPAGWAHPQLGPPTTATALVRL